MNLSDDEHDLIALHLVTGIGPRLTGALLDISGPRRPSSTQSVAELMEIPYLGQKVAESLTRPWQIRMSPRNVPRSISMAFICVYWAGPTIPPI